LIKKPDVVDLKTILLYEHSPDSSRKSPIKHEKGSRVSA